MGKYCRIPKTDCFFSDRYPMIGGRQSSGLVSLAGPMELSAIGAGWRESTGTFHRNERTLPITRPFLGSRPSLAASGLCNPFVEPAHKSNSSARSQKNWRSGTANFIHSQSICGIDDALGIIIRRKLDNRRIAGERPRRVRGVFVRAGG